jgi:hypothetical protein
VDDRRRHRDDVADGRRGPRRPRDRPRRPDLRQANAERTAPTSVGIPPFTKSLYYALGITIADGWEFQNPFIDGYTGVSAYLKSQDISVGIVTTQLPESSANGVGNATILLTRLSDYLTPKHPIELPGS